MNVNEQEVKIMSIDNDEFKIVYDRGSTLTGVDSKK